MDSTIRNQRPAWLCSAPLRSSTGRGGEVRFGIVGGFRQATGSVASNHVKQRNGYGNTDSHCEQRGAAPQEMQLELHREVGHRIHAKEIERPAGLEPGVAGGYGRVKGTCRTVRASASTSTPSATIDAERAPLDKPNQRNWLAVDQLRNSGRLPPPLGSSVATAVALAEAGQSGHSMAALKRGHCWRS